MMTSQTSSKTVGPPIWENPKTPVTETVGLQRGEGDKEARGSLRR